MSASPADATSAAAGVVAPVVPSTGALTPLGIDKVRLDGGFWGERQRLNGATTIPHCLAWEDRLGWIENYRAVADGTITARRQGLWFIDSDVYKTMEGMAWEIGRTGDPALNARFEELTQVLAAAQHPDGYLHTHYGNPGQPPRYSDFHEGHELYCFGHLIQAGVARLRTRYDDDLVALVRRVADHVCDTFGPGGLETVCGHPEIELALVELGRATGEPRYLEQARIFVERRGHGTLPPSHFGADYAQDDLPVREGAVLRGHAVRALYLTAGAIDVAVETGDRELLDAATRQYRTTLERRTYLTGGMGSRHFGEAYGEDYELPADRSYSESCAGIASVMVAWRLLLATGDMAWGDHIERVLYNIVATAGSFTGDAFLYTNTLHKRVPGIESAGTMSERALSAMRAAWFTCPCCPSNLTRTYASLAAMVATTSDQGVQIHQYTPGTIAATLPGGAPFAARVTTGYPYTGRVAVEITQAPAGEIELALRVPGWAVGVATVDGVPVDGNVARVRRAFAPGETVVLDLPMQARVTVPDARIDAVRGTFAVERGPLVLCAESPDLPAGISVNDIAADPGSLTDVGSGTDGLSAEPLAVLRGVARRRHEDGWPYPAGPEGRAGTDVEVPLVAYHAWGNRGPSTMRVWLPRA